MPLQFRQLNTGSITSLNKAINNVAPVAKPVMRTIGTIFPIDKITYNPAEQPGLPLYTLHVNDILNSSSPLDAAKQTGWLYIINNELSATVRFKETANEHTFSSFNMGQLSGELTKRINELTLNSALQSKQYEVCLLNIPPLHIFSLWLKIGTDATSDDLLIPVLSIQPALQEGVTLSAQDFINALKASALKMTEQI